MEGDVKTFSSLRIAIPECWPSPCHVRTLFSTTIPSVCETESDPSGGEDSRDERNRLKPALMLDVVEPLMSIVFACPDTKDVTPWAIGCDFEADPDEKARGVLERTVSLEISGIVLCIQTPMTIRCVSATSMGVHDGAVESSELSESCLKHENNLCDEDSDMTVASSMLKRVEVYVSSMQCRLHCASSAP